MMGTCPAQRLLRVFIRLFSAGLLLSLPLIAGCGGGGEGDDSAINLALSPDSNANQLTSYQLQHTDLHVDRNLFTGVDIFVNAIAYADIDQDGDTDVFVAPGGTTEAPAGGNGIPTPVRIYINDGAGNFTQDDSYWEGTVPTAVWPRKALTGDYNGDGRPDFAVIGHGWDASPWPGEPPLVILSGTPGKYAAASGLDSYIGFHHGGASADIDNDGDVDLMVASGGANPGTPPFFLLNNGSGSFSYNTSRLPPELVDFSAGALFSVELLDIDEDGFIDLVAAGVEPPDGNLDVTIYWGSSLGSYRRAVSTALPRVALYTNHMDMDFEDIDGDGRRDIVITRTSSNYTGYYLQLLLATGSRQYSDVSVARNSPVDAGESWIDWIRVSDHDSDGDPDIVVDDASRALVWLNDGAGNF